ncbi:D-alanyl-D-alanine carboxypeptidase [Candidatus Daviesbacteria bacterium]|nr:D-alanyl-D-alanine carboxypeptidase [Candidatus Daviesbacteria bacterium]
MGKILQAVILCLGAIVITLFLLIIQGQRGESLISPVLGQSRLKLADNIWYPKEAPKSFPDAPEISAKVAFFIEMNSGKVLFAKNYKEKTSIASLVKIMTAIVALENRNWDELLKVSSYAAEAEPDKMYLQKEERLTVEDLLKGIFLVSANDAAEVLAEGVTGRREEFINLMNSKAKQLGMYDTNFVNSTGLEEDFNPQLSSAYDVAIMSRYAIKKWPKLIEISSKPEIYIPSDLTHQEYYLISGINLLTTYPGVVGFKTGFTQQAGLTLVTVAKKEDKEVMGVLLSAVNRRDDAKLLLDYSFKKLGVK